MAPYIGADLTDRYAAGCRDIDVCGLTPTGNDQLLASFWHWQWDPVPQELDVGAIVNELRGARVAMLDGPQALASKGATLRLCERQSAAVGKTPDNRPSLGKPFAGFICSSLDLFGAFETHELPISPAVTTGGVFEVYPGHIWTILSGASLLPRKATEAGRIARKRILEAVGVSGLPQLPTHDQNDACVAALLAAACDDQVLGVDTVRVGAPLSVDPDGVMREGPMIIPQLLPLVVDRIARAVHNLGSGVSMSKRPAQSALVPQVRT